LGTRHVIPPTGLGTAANPMKAVLARARDMEAKDHDIVSINVMGGYAYADIADCGFSINCCTRGDPEVAKGYLRELAAVLEDHLDAAYPREATLDAVLAQIDAGPEVAGPILLIEPADNIGGGTPGDGTGILGPLLASGRCGIVAIINDPQAAALCHGAGAGAEVSLEIGAKTDTYHGRPVAVRATVLRLSDGRFDLENKRSHLASMMGTRIEMGPSAVIKNGQVTILLTSRKIPPMDLGQLHSQGIEPEKARFVIIKAAVSHKDAYDPIAGASYYVDSAGLCTSSLTSLPYRKLTGKSIAAP
jgi:microcystin degradation protein MlrC